MAIVVLCASPLSEEASRFCLFPLAWKPSFCPVPATWLVVKIPIPVPRYVRTIQKKWTTPEFHSREYLKVQDQLIAAGYRVKSSSQREETMVISAVKSTFHAKPCLFMRGPRLTCWTDRQPSRSSACDWVKLLVLSCCYEFGWWMFARRRLLPECVRTASCCHENNIPEQMRR